MTDILSQQEWATDVNNFVNILKGVPFLYKCGTIYPENHYCQILSWDEAFEILMGMYLDGYFSSYQLEKIIINGYRKSMAISNIDGIWNKFLTFIGGGKVRYLQKYTSQQIRKIVSISEKSWKKEYTEYGLVSTHLVNLLETVGNLIVVHKLMEFPTLMESVDIIVQGYLPIDELNEHGHLKLLIY